MPTGLNLMNLALIAVLLAAAVSVDADGLDRSPTAVELTLR